MQVETPRKQSLAVAGMSVHWPMIEALVGGTHAMRAAGQRFLPQWPRETAESYKARRETATLFPAFARTASVMAAKPFARPLQISGAIPAAIEDMLDDVDMMGTALQPYAAQLMLDCLQYGLTGVLVDYPAIEGARTRAEEQASGARPYFTRYPAQTILGWRTRHEADGLALTQLRLLECVTEESGAWGERNVEQVRVLYPGRWEVWRFAEGGANAWEWALYDQGLTSIQRIPFVFFYGLRQGFGVGAPPLLDLAHLNVEHWQSSSDQQTILHVARVPILFAKGFSEGDELIVGAASAVRSMNENADLSYVEHSGRAIEAGRQSLIDLEDRMRQAGAELLVQRPTITTATQVASEAEGGRSILQAIAEGFEEPLEACIRLMAEWINESADPEVSLYKDFGSSNLAQKTGDLLLKAAEAGIVSKETAFAELKRIDVVSAEATWEEEIERLATQLQAEAAAAAEAGVEERDGEDAGDMPPAPRR